MAQFIAFLRAINVGGHTVKMDRLRGLFEDAGLANVETFIASGNVIFDSAARNHDSLEQRIEQHLASALGYDVATFLRAPAQLGAALDATPFAGELPAGTALSVGFLKRPPTRAVERMLLDCRTDTDDLSIVGRELWWLRHGRVSDSPITGKLLERILGGPVTVRNVTTVRKLAAKYA
jgi:uncharacterized protein (DUF1697 family)